MIDGGDGTVRDVLTCGAGIYGDAWPVLIVVPSGKTNALALDLGLAQDWSLDQALAAAMRGSMVTRHPLVVAERADDRAQVRGFVVGAGAFTRAILLGQKSHKLGAFNAAVVVLTMLWALVQALLGGKGNGWRQGMLMRLWHEDGSELPHRGGLPPDQRYMLFASTLERFPAGLNPFQRHHPAAAAGGDGQCPARDAAAAGSAGARHRQRVHPGARRPSDRTGRSVHSRSLANRFILDGEAFPPGSYRRLPRGAAALYRAVSRVLEARIAAGCARPVDPAVADFAARLAQESGALAVLFYGSNLRTGSLDGVLDYYLLTGGTAERGMWPRVAYHEHAAGGPVLRAKTARMTLAKFAAAAAGQSLDTTIWARFVQPAALVWAADEAAAAQVRAALAAAAVTAARLAAAVGPARGTEPDYWRALFRSTYRAEFRVEPPGREDSILALNPGHFDGLLAAAWAAGGASFAESGGIFEPQLPAPARAATRRWWHRRQRLGKPLNLARLLRASFTFDGAARYAAWKIERHTGVALEVTPWRERHPLLAAPGVLWQLWRARR